MARPQRRTYTLVFDDLDGLTVKARSISIGELRKITSGKGDEESTNNLLDSFARALVSWDLETEDGTPVAPTAAGIDSEDQPLIMQIINAWIDAVSGTDSELGKGSPSGKPSPEESLTTELLSLSRVS